MKNKYNREFKDNITDTWFMLGKWAAILFVIAIVAFWIWEDKIITGESKCSLYNTLHIYCMGCGGTRAFIFLVHGHIFKSFMFNPFVPYSVLVYITFMINTILCKQTKKAGFTGYPVTALIIAGVVIMFVQWIIRNFLFLKFGITCL